MKIARMLIALALGLAVGAGGMLLYTQQHVEPEVPEITESTTIDIEVLRESMEKNNELSTSKYLYTASVSITDQNDLGIIGLPDAKLPFTDATYVLEADGVIKAGYDLSDVVPELEGDNTVVITLPEPKVLSHEMGEVRVTYEQQNIMNPLKAGEESAWIAAKKGEMEERAVELGLYDEARQNAKATFKSLFEPAIPDGATIDVRFSDAGGDQS